MISVSHPTGNTFVRALLQELHHRDELTRFYTTLGCGNDSILRRPLKRRSYPIPSSKILTHSWPELRRLMVSRLSLSKNKHQSPVDPIYRKLDKWTSDQMPKCMPKVIHCYEDGASWDVCDILIGKIVYPVLAVELEVINGVAI